MALKGLRLPWRRLGKLLWAGVGVFFLLYLFMVVNLIIFRHPRRIDFTQESENTLSPETLNRLALLKEEVRIVLPIFPQKDNPLFAIQYRILMKTRNLLNEYMARQPRIRMEAELNTSRAADEEAWKRICETYGLSSEQRNRFFFLSGEVGKSLLRQTLTPDDLAVYDKPEGRYDPTPPQVHRFRAEAAVTGVLTRIIQRERKRLFAVEDHREAGTLDEGPGGLSQLRKELEASGYEVVPFRLHDEPRIPGNCDLLLIAAPEGPFPLEDRGKVNDYLLSGGRLLVALGPAETGLEALLDSWQVRVQKGRVLQRRNIGPRAVWDPTFKAEDFAVGHPIVEQFRRGSFGVLFTNARALEVKQSEGLKGESLLRTSQSPATFIDRNRNGRLDEGEEAGRLVVAGVVSRPRPPRPPPGYRHVDTRLVVLGDATALSNQRFQQFSHRDFLLNALSWLLGREEQVVGGSSAWPERRLRWTPDIERFIFWVPICLFPGIVISLGGFVYFLRRS